MLKAWPFWLVTITACSSSHPESTLTSNTDSNADVRVRDTETSIGDSLDAMTVNSNDSEVAIDGDLSVDSDVGANVPEVISHWQCPKGQGFGAGEIQNWTFTITGTERVSASGASVVWRASPGALLSVADNTGAGAFVPVTDITATDTCGAFSISPSGLEVVCVTPDGGNLEIARRTAVGTDFGTPSSTEFSSIMGALKTQLTADGGPFHILQPIFASGDSTLFFELANFGIYQTSPTPPDASWSAPTFLYDPSPLTLDGAFNNSTLFLWDSNALITSIAWQWADASWTLDTLGNEQRVAPNTGCTGAYFFSNTLVYSPW